MNVVELSEEKKSMSLVNHSPFCVLVTALHMSMYEPHLPGKRQARWFCYLSGDQEIRTAISCKNGSQISGLVLGENCQRC